MKTTLKNSLLGLLASCAAYAQASDLPCTLNYSFKKSDTILSDSISNISNLEKAMKLIENNPSHELGCILESMANFFKNFGVELIDLHAKELIHTLTGYAIEQGANPEHVHHGESYLAWLFQIASINQDFQNDELLSFISLFIQDLGCNPFKIKTASYKTPQSFKILSIDKNLFNDKFINSLTEEFKKNKYLSRSYAEICQNIEKDQIFSICLRGRKDLIITINDEPIYCSEVKALYAEKCKEQKELIEYYNNRENSTTQDIVFEKIEEMYQDAQNKAWKQQSITYAQIALIPTAMIFGSYLFRHSLYLKISQVFGPMITNLHLKEAFNPFSNALLHVNYPAIPISILMIAGSIVCRWAILSGWLDFDHQDKSFTTESESIALNQNKEIKTIAIESPMEIDHRIQNPSQQTAGATEGFIIIDDSIKTTAPLSCDELNVKNGIKTIWINNGNYAIQPREILEAWAKNRSVTNDSEDFSDGFDINVHTDALEIYVYGQHKPVPAVR
jgi:hypothetical protein